MFVIPIGALLFFGSISNYLKELKLKFFVPLLLIPLISWSFYKEKLSNYEIGSDDVPELVSGLKSTTAVGVISKIPLDYSVRYYLLKNGNIKGCWIFFGTDTVHVITNQLYQQSI